MARSSDSHRYEGWDVLSVKEMYAADAGALERGIPGIALMENAAAAVVRAVRRRWTPRPTLIMCGPGNNGGDGFGVALGLAGAGWPVAVALLGERGSLRGDAALMAERWTGPILPVRADRLDGHALVVDALFGAGLTRPLDGLAAETVEALSARRLDTVAVDIPSGVGGDTGAVDGPVRAADLTVTFHRPKPGHLLMPGRGLCGELEVADIGIPGDSPGAVPSLSVNGPRCWLDRFPWPPPAGHKYHRGHALVVGGRTMTGAGRLAARAALTAGAGLVTVAAPSQVSPLYAAGLTSVMVSPFSDRSDLEGLLADKRKNSVLVGPGNGISDATRDHALAALAAGKRCVLDADALNVFANDPECLFAAIAAPDRGEDSCLLTPHDGEYERLFGAAGDRVTRARAAAARAGAVVLLKGPETVAAAPDGRAAIAVNAPPTLATAGAGDILAGLAAGLMAAGMGAFDAGCAAAWMDGEAAASFGPGLTSADLLDEFPKILSNLQRVGRLNSDGL